MYMYTYMYMHMYMYMCICVCLFYRVEFLSPTFYSFVSVLYTYACTHIAAVYMYMYMYMHMDMIYIVHVYSIHDCILLCVMCDFRE